MGIIKKIFSKNLKEIIKISAILGVSIAFVIFIITSIENYWALDSDDILVFGIASLSFTFLISLMWLLLKWNFKFLSATFRTLFTATGKTPPPWLQESIDKNPTAKQKKVVGGLKKCSNCGDFLCNCS